MTATKPPNDQLTPRQTPAEAQASVSSAEMRTEQQVKLSGDAPSAPKTETAVAVSPAAISPAAAGEVTPAGHIAAENSSRAELERLEIAERIAAFRNLQIKLRQEREKYYNAELARTRSLLAKPIKPRR